MSERIAVLDGESFCLATRSIAALPREGRLAAVVETRLGKAVVRSTITVVRARVKVPGTPDGVEYLADVVTGSLYAVKGGRCCTSSRRRLVKTAAMPAGTRQRRVG